MIQEDPAQPTRTQDQGEENVYQPFVQVVRTPSPSSKENCNEDNYNRIIARYSFECLRPSSRSSRNNDTAPKATLAPSPTANVIPIAASPTQPTGNAALTPAISIQPPEVLIDQPVSIRLSGFEPNQEVTLRATTVGTAFPDLS